MNIHTSARPRSTGLLAALLACLASCASAPATNYELLSDEAVVLPLPLIEQDARQECGLAAVDALCGYYGREIPAERRERLGAMAEEREGLSGAELREELERLGFEVYLFEGTLDRADTGLYAMVDSGWPALVMTEQSADTHHYQLFLGYDEPTDSVCLLDPARGRVLESREAFEREWAACRRFTLLALPPADDASPETLP